MMYQPRTYRQELNRDRFYTFAVQYLETDIMIGVNHSAYCSPMKITCADTIRSVRKLVDNYATEHYDFLHSHQPVPEDPDAPPAVRKMIACGIQSGTGPMSSVAGLFAFETGRKMLEFYDIKELMLENGGDIYLVNNAIIYVTIFAGDSPLSNKLAIEVPPGEWGISTSSGTVGHSVSYGRADAVTILCKDPVMSDAWATSIANRIQQEDDIEEVLKFVETHNEILGCVIIIKEKAGIRGMFNIKPTG